MQPNQVSQFRWSCVIVSSGGLWVLVYLGSRWALEHLGLGASARIAVALTPLAPFSVFLGAMIASLRSLDELHRRVHLHALTIAFPGAILVLMTLGLLQLASPDLVSRVPFRDVWPILPMLYFGGLAWSWRRYQ